MNSKLKKFVITSALCLTVYQTLPSVFYYSKPLNSYSSAKQSQHIVEEWNQALADNSEQMEAWLKSFAKTLSVNLVKISNLEHSKRTLVLDFASEKDLTLFEKQFPKALAHLPKKTFKMNIVAKDVHSLYIIKSYPSSVDLSKSTKYISSSSSKTQSLDLHKLLDERVNCVKNIYQNIDPITLRLSSLKNTGNFKKDSMTQEVLETFKLLKSHPVLFQKAVEMAKELKSPWIKEILETNSETTLKEDSLLQTLRVSIAKNCAPSKEISHPLIKDINYDLDSFTLKLTLQDEAIKLKDNPLIKGMISELITKIALESGELFQESQSGYSCSIYSSAKSPLMVTKLDGLINDQVIDIKNSLKVLYKPQSLDFNFENYPILNSAEFKNASIVEQENSLVVFSPLDALLNSPKSQADDSIFIVGKNLDKTFKELEKHHDSSKSSLKDLKQLLNLIAAMDFKLVPQAELSDAYKGDLVFELKNPTKPIWEIISENHKVHQKLGYAYTELATIKDRLSRQNLKEIKEQEALVKWHDDYYSAQNNLKGFDSLTIAKPTKNAFWSNLILNVKHFFRGSDKKIIKFGLDLSGGKNIMIQLEDHKGKKVTDPEDIKLGINELYGRVNKLGVSEVSIRQIGDYISLDFPGSQNLSAKDLVTGSTMYFHVVNEEFSYQNPELYPYVDDFLNIIWQQALQSGQTDIKSIQKIGFRLLNDPNQINLSAKKLKEKGLKLANPEVHHSSHELDVSLSKIVKIKTADSDEQHGCPLMIVFNNYALEGAALKDISISYDATKGNHLNFGVQKTIIGKEQSSLPQEMLYKWTTQFAKNKSKLSFKAPRGWRMAVVLNSEVVSSPVLEAALKDAASINGSFSQQDLLKLKADLQAGSLTFQPKIIYEQNVAPELGNNDKQAGFISMAISLILVAALMSAYYRFHGFVATSALIINLMMLFAAACFFNITLSLASIAGIVLTLGMAVDANVLIFERMREEKLKGASIKETIEKGYLKAFSAIIDSNLTTMIAAAVLLGFDSGPIKGFALTLLIGLITSVITALFMTKMFYFSWASKTKTLAMNFSNWFKFDSLDFLKHTKKACVITLVALAVGLFSFMTSGSNIVGMDFKGGYTFDLKVQNNKGLLPAKQLLEDAFIKAGLKKTQVHIRELDSPSHLRVFLDKNISSIKDESKSWADAIAKVVLNTELSLTKQNLTNLDTRITTVSGQLSESMTRQAVLGLTIALCAIFLYVLIRFEWPYALAATISLLHDVVLTISAMAIFSYFKIPVNLDMSSLAALLTIIGYSLNDTIIVFDRVREEYAHNKNVEFKKIVSKSLNTTLSRTLLTSGTTLIVLIPMIFVGQGTLFNFSLVMTTGVVLGTLSTLFIAAPLLTAFFEKKLKKTYKI